MIYPNLEAELKRCGYTRNDIADVLGIHVSGVSAMMTGKRGFSIYRARKLRDAMFPDMRIDYLFDQKPSAQSDDSDAIRNEVKTDGSV